MCRFLEIIPCCKVLYHPCASHAYTVTPVRLANISKQGHDAQTIPEASVGWRGDALLQRYRVCELCKRFPPALIHALLSARKTGIKRRKVNMEKIQGREGTLGEETHYRRNLCRIFLRGPWRMQTRSLLYKVKSPY